jgi:hypothetical protein
VYQARLSPHQHFHATGMAVVEAIAPAHTIRISPTSVSAHSSLSKCASLVRTTCLLVSSISPARKTSSRIAYTCIIRQLPTSFPPSSAAYLVEVEYQVQLTDITEESIQNLHKEMYGFEVCELVIVGVDACAEEETGVSAVDDLGHVAELDEVGLVLLVARCNEAVDLVGGQRWT